MRKGSYEEDSITEDIGELALLKRICAQEGGRKSERSRRNENFRPIFKNIYKKKKRIRMGVDFYLSI